MAGDRKIVFHFLTVADAVFGGRARLSHKSE